MKLLASILLFCTWSFANQIEIFISLNPAGSFVAKSQKLKVEGQFKTTPEGFSAKNIVLPIESLQTGIELRDDHMKQNYFEIARYPKATLLEGEGKKGQFRGKLQVHGVVQPISGEYQISNNSLEAQFKCRLSDFKIKEPKYMGVGVEDEVSVSVKLSPP